MVKLLLQAGANKNAKDEVSCTLGYFFRYVVQKTIFVNLRHVKITSFMCTDVFFLYLSQS